MIQIIFVIHDHRSFMILPFSFSLKHNFTSLPFIHLPPSTCFLSIFSHLLIKTFHFNNFQLSTPLLSLLLPSFYACSYSSQYYPHTLPYVHLPFLIFTSSFHHHLLPLFFLPILLPHILTLAHITQSLKCPHKFLTHVIMLFNFFFLESFPDTIYQQTCLPSLNTCIYIYVYIYILFSLYLYLPPLVHVVASLGLLSHCIKTPVFLSYPNKLNFCLIFSECECHFLLFLSLK